MNLPFMTPMFDARQSIFGLPDWVVVGLVAAVGFAVGLWLLRRTWAWGDEYRSFRATDRDRSRLSDLSTPVVLAVVLVVLGMLVGAAWSLPATVFDLLF